MFDVLLFLYETYWRPDAFPSAEQLTRKLSAAGFEEEEIEDALDWLDGLETAIDEQVNQKQPRQTSIRVFVEQEIQCVGEDSIGYLCFLLSANVIDGPMRDLILDRAIATGLKPLPVDQIKVIVLWVFWRLGKEPDALILDELFVESEERVHH